MYDLIIIGGGPAAAGAAVYAGRKLLSTLVVTKDFQGQSFVSPDIRNWIGEVSISGMDLSEKLEEHVRNQPGVTVKNDEQVNRIEKTADGYQVKSDKDSYTSRTVIVASGGRRKKLQVPGEEELDGLGVAYCATCDAPLFEDEDVAVIGAGNSALETVIDLSSYARKIYVITRGERLKGDPVNRRKVEDLPEDRLTLITNATVQAIQGEKQVEGLRYYDKSAREEKTIEVTGVFVAIGSVPNSGMVGQLVDMNTSGEIIVDHKTGLTSDSNIGAAGDVTDDPFKQNNIAVAGGIRAALSLYSRLLDMKKYSPCSEPEDCDESA
ncbi:MAG: FAD-dependent oxidoreductase [Desulfohalobiaceae bacterium]|nr:FAD-dependent oxidoreductase [Desulfohalobiaceae bacterium]